MSTYVHHRGVHIPGDVHLLKEKQKSEFVVLFDVIILIERNEMYKENSVLSPLPLQKK